MLRTDQAGCAAVNRRAIIIAPDTAVMLLSALVRRCGLDIIGIFMGPTSVAIFDLEPDLVLVKVRRGQEMRAYYIGCAAAERGIATVFTAMHAQAPVIEALVRAVPHSILIEFPCGNSVFADRVAAALNGTGHDRHDDGNRT